MDLERECAGVDAGELEEVVDEHAEPPGLVAQRTDVLVRLGEAVVDRLEHGADRCDRRPQVVARRGDEFAAGIEEALETRGHLVERAAELGELARPVPRAPGRRGRLPATRAEAACSRSMLREIAVAENEPGGDGGRCRGRRDGEDLDVVAHVEHDPAGEEDDEEREQDREQGEPDQLEPHRREHPQPQRRDKGDRRA